MLLLLTLPLTPRRCLFSLYFSIATWLPAIDMESLPSSDPPYGIARVTGFFFRLSLFIFSIRTLTFSLIFLRFSLRSLFSAFSSFFFSALVGILSRIYGVSIFWIFCFASRMAVSMNLNGFRTTSGCPIFSESSKVGDKSLMARFLTASFSSKTAFSMVGLLRADSGTSALL